jgi:uncharacterized SAM-binding protein YcdF (DUF218 family)
MICPLGGDLAEEGSRLGQRTINNDKRCASQVLLLLLMGKQVRVVLSAGHAKIHGKSDKFPKQTVSMAVMMREHLTSLGVPSELCRIPRETWGTKAELETVRMEIEAIEGAGGGVEEIILVASWWHAYRTRRNAEVLLRRPVRVQKTADDASDRDLLEELVKIIAEEIRIRMPIFGTLLRLFRGRD